MEAAAYELATAQGRRVHYALRWGAIHTGGLNPPNKQTNKQGYTRVTAASVPGWAGTSEGQRLKDPRGAVGWRRWVITVMEPPRALDGFQKKAPCIPLNESATLPTERVELALAAKGP